MSGSGLELVLGVVIRRRAGLASERYRSLGAAPRRRSVGGMSRLRGPHRGSTWSPRSLVGGFGSSDADIPRSRVSTDRVRRARGSSRGFLRQVTRTRAGGGDAGSCKGSPLAGIDSPVPPAESVGRMSLRGVSGRIRSVLRVWCELIATGDEGVVGIVLGGRRGMRVGRWAVAGDLLAVTCLTCHPKADPPATSVPSGPGWALKTWPTPED